MKPELMHSAELAPNTKPAAPTMDTSGFTPEVAASLFEQRLAQAEEMQPHISLKFYYFIKEKVVREQATARKLLNVEENKQEILDKYSFILNPSYFEQKIIS